MPPQLRSLALPPQPLLILGDINKSMATLDPLRYPIGPYEAPKPITSGIQTDWIAAIAAYPQRLIDLTSGLTDEQLALPYRPGGWTIRQVVHHVADSHTHAYIRFKWTLTEDTPLIKAYGQDSWAKLSDSQTPIDHSLLMLQGIHQRWTHLMQAMEPTHWEMAYLHPEDGKEHPLKKALGLYVWHGNHHYAHVEMALAQA